MDIVINKNEDGNVISYQIDKGDVRIVVDRETPFMFQIMPKTQLFFKGVGTLFNIPGGFNTIQLGSKNTDGFAIQKDWERVGQSMYDGIILFNEQ